MLCEKCGTTNEDGAKFCVGCGNVFEAESAPAPEAEVYEEAPAPAENDFLKKIMKFAVPVAAVAVVVIILAIFGVFKDPAVKTLEKFLNATVKCDGKALYTLSVDPYQEEYWIEEEIYEDKAEIIDEYKDRADDTSDYLEDEYGKNVRIKKLEIKSVEKYDKKKIKALNEYLEECDYDAYNEGKNIIQNIRVIKAKVTVKGSEDDDSNTDEYVVYKMKGKWYVGSFAGLYDKDSIKDIIKEYK